MIKPLHKTAFFILFSLIGFSSVAQEYNDHTNFEKYSVHYTVFNSTFIKPDIASIYGIKRSKYENILNVSVTPVGQYGGLPVKLSGTVTNLMQQQKVLDFIQIKEESVTYYLAPVRINNKEVVHFNLQVTPEGETDPLTVKFSKTLYAD